MFAQSSSLCILLGVISFSHPNAIITYSKPQQTPSTPLYDGLGKHSRRVSQHALAQRYFDQGLNFLFAFNHDEARRAFRQAITLDAECGMAHWGVAMTYGSHINKPTVKPEQDQQAMAAIMLAIKYQAKCREADRCLIDCLALRFAEKTPNDRTELNAAYSKAMKAAWEKYPEDADIGSLYAESIMNLRPWDLWTRTGEPHPGTPEILAALEAVMKVNPDHPLALHLYIHAVEASPNPGKASVAADRLRHLTPGLGHLVHMPSHIDVRTGNWQASIEANERAIATDAAYRKIAPRQDFYHLYMAHNHHMLAYAAMMSGQSQKALKAVRMMLAGVPTEWVAVKENAAIADGFLAAPLEVMVRFGQWEAILKEPAMPAGFPIARSLRHHARAVALAALGRTAEAREEQKLFQQAIAETPKEAQFGNNPASALYSVAELMLEGELLFHEGNKMKAIIMLYEAVQKEDELGYNEPPDWIIPVRHPLGAILLSIGHAEEAERVYRADLQRWPQNGWSLFGLMKSLRLQGRDQEARKIEEQWQKVWSKADISLEASCKCVNK